MPGLRGGGGEARGRAEARGGAAGGRAGAEAWAATEAAAAGAFEGDAVGELGPEAAVARRGGVLCVFSGLVCVGRQWAKGGRGEGAKKKKGRRRKGEEEREEEVEGKKTTADGNPASCDFALIRPLNPRMQACNVEKGSHLSYRARL